MALAADARRHQGHLHASPLYLLTLAHCGPTPRSQVKLNKNAAGEQVRGALYLEASMLLANRALLLADEARLTVGPAGNGDVKRAADLLKRSAGVLE